MPLTYCCQNIRIWLALGLFLLLSQITEAQSMRILPLGNSITEGTDGNPLEESLRIAYRYTLYNLLTTGGYNFDFVGHKNSGYGIFPDAQHGGIPGTRDQYLVRLLQDGYDLRWGQQITTGGQPYLDQFPADLILLHIGTNDLIHNEGPSPTSVGEILDEINNYEVRSGNEVTVLVARIINQREYDQTISQYNNNVASMVASRNDPDIIMVDIENGAGINYSLDIKNDGVHPTESGYTKMGQKWFEAIQALNQAPFFTSIPVTSAFEDETYSYMVTVDDENPSDNLTVIAGTKPDWCTFTYLGNNSGLLTGTPSDGDGGDHPVSLIVSDGKMATTQNFTISVNSFNDPPIITAQSEIDTDEDRSFIMRKEFFTIVDDDNSLSELNLILLEGNNYTIEGTVVTPDQDFYGTIQVGVKVSDSVASSDIFMANVSVNSVNDPPQITGQKNSLKAKQLVSLEIKLDDLYFEDVDNEDYELTVEVQPDPNSLFIINGSYMTVAVDTSGPIEVWVKLFDGQDQGDAFALIVDVNAAYNPPQFTTYPPLEAIAGTAYFYLVDAADPDEGDQLTYSAPTLPGWLSFNDEMKLLGGNPSINDTGSVQVILAVTDGRFIVEQKYQLEVRHYTSSESGTLIGGDQDDSGLIEEAYPVPAHESLHIVLDREGEVEIQVIDISGKVLQRIQRNLSPRSDIEISLRGYNPGIYFIRVFSGESMDTRKVIIR